MLNVNYGFPKMGRGGCSCFGFWFHDGVGSPRFFMVFSSGIGCSRIFVFLKGEIEREMGRENNRGGFLLSSYVVFLLV